MNTSHTIRAHAQEVWGKLDKIKGGRQSGRKVVTHNSKSDLPLMIYPDYNTLYNNTSELELGIYEIDLYVGETSQ